MALRAAGEVASVARSGGLGSRNSPDRSSIWIQRNGIGPLWSVWLCGTVRLLSQVWWLSLEFVGSGGGVAVRLAQGQLLDANAVDYGLLALYFVFVLGIGYVARRAVSTSLDFFL
ncbi:hypothetical protein, partial [Saccharopolyspora sp. 5N708]|uniref:hypothetical protein n=1 Tax=Saccharopolyspora sp. 5N708 TaxID=3457424 RepID=UPI003FD1C690